MILKQRRQEKAQRKQQRKLLQRNQQLKLRKLQKHQKNSNQDTNEEGGIYIEKFISSYSDRANVYENLSKRIDCNKEVLYIPLAGKYDEFNALEEAARCGFNSVNINQVKTINSSKDLADDDLSKYGAIYIDDGNEYKLLFELKVNGVFDKLKKYADMGGTICGVGSGALIFTDDINSSSSKSENYVGLVDTRGLNIINKQDFEDKCKDNSACIVFKGGNNMDEREVKPFTMWRHFKGSRAMVITVANHSETGESLVVYRCMDNNGNTNHKDGIYARPMSMFLSEVDHEKYPDVTQKYRFEEIINE